MNTLNSLEMTVASIRAMSGEHTVTAFVPTVHRTGILHAAQDQCVVYHLVWSYEGAGSITDFST